MDKEPELTDREKILRRLGKARRYHKMSVRWLFDVSRLASMYKSSESWKATEYEDIAEVANKDYEDAMLEVIRTRQLIDRVIKILREHDERDI